jgi:hypothetical protein
MADFVGIKCVLDLLLFLGPSSERNLEDWTRAIEPAIARSFAWVQASPFAYPLENAILDLEAETGCV